MILTLKIRRLFLPYRHRQQPVSRPINFKKEETVAHMLPVSNLRQSLPNTRKKYSCREIFFKEYQFSCHFAVFFFVFFFLFIPSPEAYWIPSTSRHHSACGGSYAFLHSFIHLTTKYRTTMSIRNPARCGAYRAQRQYPSPGQGQGRLVLSRWLLSDKISPQALWPLSHLLFTAILGPFYRWGN